jgi:hypothetical protein
VSADFYLGLSSGAGGVFVAWLIIAGSQHLVRARFMRWQRSIPWPTKHTSSCLINSADDEPVFVLCARDPAAPDAIIMWRSMAERRGTPNSKLIDAAKVQQVMLEWQRLNAGRVRVPS